LNKICKILGSCGCIRIFSRWTEHVCRSLLFRKFPFLSFLRRKRFDVTPRSPIIGQVSWFWSTHISLGTWHIQKLLKQKL
jgi:hypothetical protein